MTYLIGLSGKMRSGKDHGADFLLETLHKQGKPARKIAFADTLKELAAHIQRTCGFPEEKDRALLQFLGTNFARARDTDVWVKCFVREFAKARLEMPTCTFIVTDCRFPNEVEALEDLGFTLARITASEKIRIDRGADVENLYHASETGLDPYDVQGRWNCVIKNEGTQAEYEQKLLTLLS